MNEIQVTYRIQVLSHQDKWKDVEYSEVFQEDEKDTAIEQLKYYQEIADHVRFRLVRVTIEVVNAESESTQNNQSKIDVGVQTQE